jgi:hypothetical protein
VHDHRPKRKVIESERELLRCLWQTGGIADAPSDTLHTLRQYSWVDADHRIVFQALLRLGDASAKSLREQLPAEATRMGFPDIDWNVYWATSINESARNKPLAERILELVAELARPE